MKNLRWYLAIVLCLSSLYSHAVLIVDSATNIPLETGETGFSINMLEHGHNPATDIPISVTFTMRFREIIDNGDDWYAATTEFVVFFTR